MKWQRIKYMPCLPLGKDGKRATSSVEHKALARKAATESIVLLKNENNALPLKKGSSVALLGKASADYVSAGGGSGTVTSEYVHNICDGMEEKQSEGKVTVFSPLCGLYRKSVAEQYAIPRWMGQTFQPEFPEELFSQASKCCDTAIISICRRTWEGADVNIKKENCEYYINHYEKRMIDFAIDNFKKVIVVLNVHGVIDLSYLASISGIDAMLVCWNGGMEGGMAIADVLCGDACPSGRLVDTFVSKLEDYPSHESFTESDDFVEYTEDIYVGYRYFETIPDAYKNVIYPFGYGLSYTDFKIEITNAKIENDIITVNIVVTNIGKMAGKEVIQLYSSAPQGRLGKPDKELKAFSKTNNLEPNQSCEIELTVDVKDIASYDESKAAYILEEGIYSIYVGKNVRENDKILEFEIFEERIIKQLKNRMVPKKLSRRMLADGTYENLKTSEYKDLLDTSSWPEKESWFYNHIRPNMMGIRIPKDRILLVHVAEGKNTLEEFMAQLSDVDLIELVGGRPNRGPADTYGMGDLEEYGVPAMMTADGPGGLRFKKEYEIPTTAWPTATALACTWNTDIVYEVGRAAALEVKENNMGMWLAPGLNIHRYPLCGRNFEYYSEDPYLSGVFAASMVKGIQSRNISACIKHFCCNNKEVGRDKSDSRVSERALREIYLKGFEIAIKASKPWALMTCYNKVNGYYASEQSELLNEILREEFGFDGLVTTDWANGAEHYRELLAGNDIRMPVGSGKRMIKALELGLITRTDLERSAKRVLELILKLD